MAASLITRASAVVLCAGIGTSVAAQEHSWDMPNTFGRNSSDGVADVLFAELLQDTAEGRIEIVHHFDGSLGYRGADLLEAVGDGAVPIARHAMVYYGGFDPMFLLAALPFLVLSVDDLEVLHEVAGPHFEESFARYNQVVISYGLFPPSGVWSREPLESLEDLQGLRLRAFDLNSLETFSGAGAAAVNMNWGDVIPAVSTGAIDAVVTSADLGVTSSLYEYLPAFLEINWAVPLSAVTVNREVWDGLPEDLQQALIEAGEEARIRTFERLRTQVDENYADMRERGLSVTEDAPEDLTEALHGAAEPVIARWRESAGDRASVLDDYLAAVGR